MDIRLLNLAHQMEMSDNKIIQNTLHSKLAAVVGATVPKKKQGIITKKMKSNKNKQ